MRNNPGYESLAGVLQRALDQAQDGKGAERHANSLPFDKQPMQTIAGQVGVGFLIGQAIKKTQESQTLPAGRDVAELLGAINYLAGAVIFLESRREPVPANDNRPSVEKEKKHAPILELKRFNELDRKALEMVRKHAKAAILRKRADEMLGH